MDEPCVAEDPQALELCAAIAGWEAKLDSAKRKVRSELSIPEWKKYGFAGNRSAEFDALAAAGDCPEGAVPRFRHGELSFDEFRERYECKRLPCVISGTPEAEMWPAWCRWSWQDFCRRFPRTYFRVGKDDSGNPVQIRVDHFAQYQASQCDDSPLYLFDSKFGKEPELLQEYSVPSYFPDDFMSLAGPKDRPPYRWIGIGPRRSGTVMHQDPLCTSAWNTLLSGRKRWVLIPPEVPRSQAKGKRVMLEGDDDEAINHFLDLLPRQRKEGLHAIEFVQHPGDTVFLPGDWWHCVVNLDDTIAVTQNYCGRSNFDVVWRRARTERPCWSKRWLRGMDERSPELAAKARRLNEEDGFDMMAVLEKNRLRRKRQRERRDQRELRRARRRTGNTFNEKEWWCQRPKERDDSDASDTTASTTSSSESSTSSGASSG